MHVAITGAAGFVGAGLVRRIIGQGLPKRPPATRITTSPKDDAASGRR